MGENGAGRADWSSDDNKRKAIEALGKKYIAHDGGGASGGDERHQCAECDTGGPGFLSTGSAGESGLDRSAAT